MSTSQELRHRISLAKDQLQLVLGFFPRVDAKHTAVLAINTGMLAYLAARIPTNAGDVSNWYFGAGGLAILLLGSSLCLLFVGIAPHLGGGKQSLIYFKEIAVRTEAKYIAEFIDTTEEEYLRELLGQVWRNSSILERKFRCLQGAIRATVVSVVPWLVALIGFALS
jgi:hypothetical protein